MVSKHSWPSFAAVYSVQGRSLTFLRIEKATIVALIKKNGGIYTTKVSSDDGRITHLITTAKHIEAQAKKGKTFNPLLIQLRMAYLFPWRTR